MIVAVLSTVVIPLDGTYQVQTLETSPAIAGTPHYVGHPDTKAIVEELGAIPASSKLFTGLQVGESAIAFPIKQGRSNRAQGGTAVNQAVTIEDLDIRLVTRIAWKRKGRPATGQGKTLYIPSDKLPAVNRILNNF